MKKSSKEILAEINATFDYCERECSSLLWSHLRQGVTGAFLREEKKTTKYLNKEYKYGVDTWTITFINNKVGDWVEESGVPYPVKLDAYDVFVYTTKKLMDRGFITEEYGNKQVRYLLDRLS